MGVKFCIGLFVQQGANKFRAATFEKWSLQHKILLMHGQTHFTMSDLRKFCEQMGDILQWDQSNKNYILTHGVSGVDWRFYKHPLPEQVYNVYMKYWKEMRCGL